MHRLKNAYKKQYTEVVTEAQVPVHLGQWRKWNRWRGTQRMHVGLGCVGWRLMHSFALHLYAIAQFPILATQWRCSHMLGMEGAGWKNTSMILFYHF